MREVSLNVDLVGSIVGIGGFPRGESNLVALGCKSFSYTRPNSRSGAKNEDDRGCGRHDDDVS